MRKLAYAVIVLLCGMLTIPAAVGRIKEKMHVGEMPPDYLGRDIEGNEVRLSAEPGKVTVITFWATWCGPCLREIPVLEAAQEIAGRDRLRVVAINFAESKSTFKRVSDDFGHFKLTFVYDARGTVANRFGIDAIPHMYMVNKRGEIAKIRVGYGENSIKDLTDSLNALMVEK